MSDATLDWYLIDLDRPFDRTWLAADEQARADCLRDPQRATRQAAARAALRGILARRTGEPPAALVFAYGQHGKPALATHPTLHFNVAHSGAQMLCVVAEDRAVGVDLELLARSGARDLLRFLAPEEQAYVATLPLAAREAAILTIWVQKEAVLKASGTGLTVPLASFAVCCTTTSVVRWPDATPWQLHRWEPVPGYVAALAAAGPYVVRHRQFD